MPIRHVQVRLEDDEFDTVEKAAKREGLPLQTFGRVALLERAGFRKAGDDAPTPQEGAVILAVLDLLRDKSVPSDSPVTIKRSLLEMGRQRAKRRGSPT